jgi:hypothetical protein
MAAMHYPFVSQMHLQGREEGRIEERASSILWLLGHRGIAVDAVSRERIQSCRDLKVLGVWRDRSFTVARATDLFA